MPADLQELLHAFRNRLNSRRSDAPLALSDLISSIYADTMAHLDRRLGSQVYQSAYRDRSPCPESIRDEIGLAGELWCYFTTHFFKVYQALLEGAFPIHIEDLIRSPFGCSRLTILDVGAGIGTAALAAIDILQQWQSFLLSSGHVPVPVEVTVQPVEINRVNLPILNRMLEQAAQRVRPSLVQVRQCPPVTFHYPDEDCLQAIRQALAGGGPHALITLSNILT